MVGTRTSSPSSPAATGFGEATTVNAPVSSAPYVRPDANYYPGDCSDCGAPVGRLAGTRYRTSKRRSGWAVRCMAHSPADPNAPKGGAGSQAPAGAGSPAGDGASRPDAPVPTDGARAMITALLNVAAHDPNTANAEAIRSIAACVEHCAALAGLAPLDAAPALPDPASVAADLLADLGLGAPRPVTCTNAMRTPEAAPARDEAAAGRAAARAVRAEITAGHAVRRDDTGETIATVAPGFRPFRRAAPPTPAPAPTTRTRPAPVDRFAALRGGKEGDDE